MGIFSSIFGTSTPDDKQKFVTLRDDGVRALQMGEAAYAERCLCAALELQDDPEVTGLLAEVYLRERKHQEALPLLLRLAEHQTPKDNLNLFMLLAAAQGELGLFEEERATAARIISEYADETGALYYAAEADSGLGDDLQAIVNLTRALSLREDFAAARLLRCRVLIRMGQNAEALEDIELLIKDFPETEEYLALRGGILSKLDRTEEAVADFERVNSLNPFDRDAIVHLATLYERIGLRDKALDLYDEAVNMMPDFADAYKERGGIKHRLGDELGAAEDLKRALELTPVNQSLPDGEYSNVENEVNQRYRNMNPYGF